MLTIEGIKYKGYFIGEPHRYKNDDGYSALDYQGTGAIEIRETGGKILFHFRTPTFLLYRARNERVELADAVINWRQDEISLESVDYRVVAYPEIVDLALEDLLRRVRWMSNSPIPDVETSILADYDLFDRGLLALPED